MYVPIPVKKRGRDIRNGVQGGEGMAELDWYKIYRAEGVEHAVHEPT